MTTELIPADTRVAAKRGFIRTATQSLATSLVLPAGTVFAFTQDALLSAAIGAGTMLVGAVINGLQSYFRSSPTVSPMTTRLPLSLLTTRS